VVDLEGKAEMETVQESPLCSLLGKVAAAY